jgi:hypothetical protein
MEASRSTCVDVEACVFLVTFCTPGTFIRSRPDRPCTYVVVHDCSLWVFFLGCTVRVLACRDMPRGPGRINAWHGPGRTCTSIHMHGPRRLHATTGRSGTTRPRGDPGRSCVSRTLEACYVLSRYPSIYYSIHLQHAYSIMHDIITLQSVFDRCSILSELNKPLDRPPFDSRVNCSPANTTDG